MKFHLIQDSKIPSWEETKDYQRFIEDQRLAENMGLIEKSSVTAFLEEYYKENPLDNSYEGILARRSGLTKETVVSMLDIIDISSFISSYDTSELGPLASASSDSNSIKIINGEQQKGTLVLPGYERDIQERSVRNFAV